MAQSPDFTFQNQVEKLVEISTLKNDVELQDAIRPLIKEIRREITLKFLRMALKLTLVLVAIVLLIFYTPIHSHVRALGRIGLIKITPYWDWNKLYYESCLVKNSVVGSRDNMLEEIECTSCEDFKGIQVLRDIDPKLIYDNYITQELPVIVSDGAVSWKIFNDQHFWFGNISEAYEKLYNRSDSWALTLPCHFTSNLRIKPGLLNFFDEIYEHQTKPFFAHWENCDKPSIKLLRQFYERPYFASPAVDLSFNNWLLVSSLYKATIFRELELDSNLALVTQIRGFNRFQLSPHKTCSAACQTFEISLEEGEILVVTPSFWTVKYQPGEDSDNLAFIIQAEMD